MSRVLRLLRLRNTPTEAEIGSVCLQGETKVAILAYWQASLQIQIEEKNYEINNCQHSFLYDLKLAASLFSLNMGEVTIRC